MAANRQIEASGERNGVPLYKTNPSIQARDGVANRYRTTQIAAGGKAVVINGSGEVLGKANIAFMQTQEVDSTKFVKLYIEGLQMIAGLTRAGSTVCEIVYERMQEKANNDQIFLKYSADKDRGITERTYRRGVKDLLEKEIIYASLFDGVYFLNIRFMFNGDRLHFVKSYHRIESVARDSGQFQLGVGDDA